MKNVIIILLFNVICVVKVNSCNVNCDINVDSLFETNLSELKKTIGSSSTDVIVQERNNIKFLYAISLLSGRDFISDPHNAVVSSKTVIAIGDWYQKKKKYITCEKIKKVYSLLEPPLLNDIEEVEKYSNELEQLKIKDE